MTKQTTTKTTRKKFNIPRRSKIASFRIDHERKQIVFTTKNMIQNQLHRDGPVIRRSFDDVSRSHIAACSEVFGEAAGLIIRHLPKIEDDSFKPTASRLLNSACATFLASLEVARHGYRRQYGMLARSLVETIATVIALTIKPDALDQFHAGSLKSTKCVGWANAALPPLGMYYGMLSDEFVHIGRSHAAFDPLTKFKQGDSDLNFILSSLRSSVWMLHLATELVFHDEIADPKYWKEWGEGVTYDPSKERQAWMTDFLVTPTDIGFPTKPPLAPSPDC